MRRKPLSVNFTGTYCHIYVFNIFHWVVAMPKTWILVWDAGVPKTVKWTYCYSLELISHTFKVRIVCNWDTVFRVHWSACNYCTAVCVMHVLRLYVLISIMSLCVINSVTAKMICVAMNIVLTQQHII